MNTDLIQTQSVPVLSGPKIGTLHDPEPAILSMLLSISGPKTRIQRPIANLRDKLSYAYIETRLIPWGSLNEA